MMIVFFFQSFFFILGNFWFIWLPLALFFLGLEIWLAYIQLRYKKAVEWTLLEIRIPRELRKSPRAMDQIFANMAGLRNAPDIIFPTSIKEKYWDGEVTLWFSMEIASFGGESHFFVRTPTKHKNVLEAFFYSQYPDIELAEVDDYIDRLPQTVDEIHQGGYELTGGEFKLGKEDAYPIRTYLDFESPQEEHQLDPISSLLELFGKLKPEEDLWFQVLVRPADPAPTAYWKSEGEALVKKLKEAGQREIPIIGMPAEAGEAGTMPLAPMRTPGEIETLKAVERCLGKQGFEVVIRYIHFAPVSIYDKDFAKRGVNGALNQYSSGALNFFLGSRTAKTKADWHEFPFFFPGLRTLARQKDLLKKYQERSIPEQTFIGQWLASSFFHWQFSKKKFSVLNTEELATIYHLPSHLVLTAPFVRRVEAKKAGPPVGLPIFEE